MHPEQNVIADSLPLIDNPQSQVHIARKPLQRVSVLVRCIACKTSTVRLLMDCHVESSSSPCFPSTRWMLVFHKVKKLITRDQNSMNAAYPSDHCDLRLNSSPSVS